MTTALLYAKTSFGTRASCAYAVNGALMPPPRSIQYYAHRVRASRRGVFQYKNPSKEWQHKFHLSQSTQSNEQKTLSITQSRKNACCWLFHLRKRLVFPLCCNRIFCDFKESIVLWPTPPYRRFLRSSFGVYPRQKRVL